MTTPSGGFGALGGLIVVVSLLLTMRKAPPGPIGKLARAGATSAETALKPKTAGIMRDHELDRARRNGLVVELDDGRCWVDVRRVKRRRLAIGVVVAIALGIAIEAAWLLIRWTGLI